MIMYQKLSELIYAKDFKIRNHSFFITKASKDDVSDLSSLIKKSMLPYCTSSKIPTDKLEALTETKEDILNRINNNLCLIARDTSGKAIGTICLIHCNNPMKYSFSQVTENFLFDHSDCYYITRFAVDDDLQGTGIGSILLDEVIKIVQNLNGSLVLLHVALSNTDRVNYYLNRNFKIVDSETSRGYERGLFAFDL